MTTRRIPAYIAAGIRCVRLQPAGDNHDGRGLAATASTSDPYAKIFTTASFMARAGEWIILNAGGLIQNGETASPAR